MESYQEHTSDTTFEEPRTNFKEDAEALDVEQQQQQFFHDDDDISELTVRTTFTSGMRDSEKDMMMDNNEAAYHGGVEPPPHTQHHRVNNFAKYDGAWYTRMLTGTPAVIMGALLGVLLGLVLSNQIKDPDQMELTAKWISLPGDLFIRALKLIVVPMVFASLSVGMADILAVGKGSVIGLRTACFYVGTSILSSTQAVLWSLVYRGFFKSEDGVMKSFDPEVALECPSGGFLTQDDSTGLLSCTTGIASNATQAGFKLMDLNEVFERVPNNFQTISLGDQIIGLLEQIVSDNITAAFTNGALLSIVFFAVPFGIAVSKTHRPDRGPNYLLEFMRQINNTFLLMVRWIISITPLAVISLIGGSIAKNQSEYDSLKNVGYFVLAMFCSTAHHTVIVMPGIFFLFTRRNPYTYLIQMLPAQIFAFGCASSMATLPVTLRCVDSTKQVSRAVSRFILSIGATVNMDGSAIFFPIAVVFLAETSGLGNEIKAVQLVMLVVVSTIASIGGAPVPSASLVMIITVWQTILDQPIPDSFSYLVGIDWLVDRFRTVTNVTGDALVTRIVADQVDETYLDEQDRTQTYF